MSTWETLSVKYDYMFAGCTVLVGRGMSAGWLSENTEYLEHCDRIVMVNDWHGDYPDFFDVYAHKVMNFLYPTHRPWLPAKSIVKDADGVKKFCMTQGKIFGCATVVDGNRRNADTGLNAVMYESFRSKRLLIAGIDFWAAEYWPGKKRTCEQQSKMIESKADAMRKRCIHALLSFLEKSAHCEYLIHTECESLKRGIRKLSRVHVKLI